MYQLDKAINTGVKSAWKIELEQLEREQAEDLKESCMSWWEPPQLTEAEYFEMMAEGIANEY